MGVPHIHGELAGPRAPRAGRGRPQASSRAPQSSRSPQELLARRGDLEKLRTRADAGDKDVAKQLAGLLEQRGDLDVAAQILRAPADGGDLNAALQLAWLLARRGDMMDVGGETPCHISWCGTGEVLRCTARHPAIGNVGASRALRRGDAGWVRCRGHEGGETWLARRSRS